MYEDSKIRNFSLAAVGALFTLAFISFGKLLNEMRPAIVDVLKEGYAFKEWLFSNIEKGRENIEDIFAESKHAYQKDLRAMAELVKREKELLRKVEEQLEKKMKRSKTAKKEE